MRLKPSRVVSLVTLAAPALVGFAVLPGCGPGSPPLEVQQANMRGELEAEENPQNPETPGAKTPRRTRNPNISTE